MEQWAARNFPDDEVLFSWIVNPTVIIGRHQCLETEVDIDYCTARGIDIVRRLSGGGCVYADPENLMISYVCPTRRPAPDVFAGFVQKLAGILQGLGIDAEVSGRNDIVIGGRKVSGCAYYHTGTHAIIHTTMLFGADPTTMSAAITPDRSKLASRGVRSVASRITTISEHNPKITISDFRLALSALADREVTLTPGQELEIRAIEATYRTPGHLHGRRAGGGILKTGRIDGVGGVQARMLTDDEGKISKITFTGDFLTGNVPIERLEEALTGQRPDDIRLPDTDVSAAIAGLSGSQLSEILTQQ